jgi:hypothetical protein
VRPLLLLAAALLLAGHAPGAHADTMYKCVDAKGKIAYSNLPCPGLAKAAREFEVAAPESAEDSAARLGAERARLRKEEAAFKLRHARRNAALDDRLRQGEIARRRQEQADLNAMRRQQAQEMQQRGEAGPRKAIEARH